MKTTTVFLSTALAAIIPSALPLTAQEDEPPPVEWKFEGSAGASVFFGASDQTTVTTAVETSRTSQHWKWDLSGAYLYGEAQDEGGGTFVNKRFWNVASAMGYQRFERVNPYGFASAMSSLEKAIKRRYKAGAGARLTAIENVTTDLNFGLAALGERTVQYDANDGDSEFLFRWKGELDYRRSFSEDRTILQAQAEYNPVFDEFDNYTIDAETSLTFKLSEIISLKFSVVDKYDSRAKDRGARDNNDGQVLFSVLASF